MGFLHNVYRERDNRTTQMLSLPAMVQRILKACPGAQRVDFGGDFNVRAPQTNRGGRRNPLYPHGAGIPTTVGGNEYDYWYSNVLTSAPANLHAYVEGVTHNTRVGLSDHDASLLWLH